MAMGGHILMHTDQPPRSALLILTQWFSAAFPTGAFSYSHGLEWAVGTGDVRDSKSFGHWLGSVLAHGCGRNDAIVLATAWRARTSDALHEADIIARALAPSAERLAETLKQGAAFRRALAHIWQIDTPELAYPAAVGTAAQAMQLPLKETLLFYLQAFAANLASAAIRLVPLGQQEGHAVLAAQNELIRKIANEAMEAGLDDLGGCAFMADIASMKHETQRVRLFQS